MKDVTFNYLENWVTIKVHDDEHISNLIDTKASFYELQFLEFVRDNYYFQNTIIDIGANIGNHSRYFSEFLNSKYVISFEPFKENFELLKFNMKGREGLQINLALGDKDGELSLYNSETDNNGGYSFKKYNTSFLVDEKVAVKTLDSFNFSDVSMIKIDVEGFEEEVLNGSIDTITKNKPIIFVENLGYTWPELFDSNRFHNFFENIGYVQIEKNLMYAHMDLWIPKD